MTMRTFTHLKVSLEKIVLSFVALHVAVSSLINRNTSFNSQNFEKIPKPSKLGNFCDRPNDFESIWSSYKT